jgi:aminoglycoside N3'-acetyltransferase
MVNFEGSYRSKHPIQKFVAIGKLASKLTNSHDKDSFAYGVLRDMVELGGKNVKVGPEEKVPGVGTTHVAICDLSLEQRRLPKGVYYKAEDNSTKYHQVNWVGGCGFGFANLMDEFKSKKAVLHEGKLGDANLKITDMNKTYHIEMEKLDENPKYILCDKSDCIDCRVSWSFSDKSYFSFLLNQKSLRKIFLAIFHAVFSKKLKGQTNVIR